MELRRGIRRAELVFLMAHHHHLIMRPELIIHQPSRVTTEKPWLRKKKGRS